jgi:hypothetical protein
MPNTAAIDQLTKAQEWALEQMKANQERVIDLNKKVASLVEKLPAVKVPFADRLPDQKDLVSKYFDFVAKSTEANREFATAIVNVWTGTDGAESPKPAAKARSAAKAS